MFEMLSSFLNPGQGYKKASKEAEKGYQEGQGYQQPFYQHGLDAYPQIGEALRKLLNPAELQSEFSKSYETSPEAKRMLEMNTGQGLDAASSMGLMGSSGALQNIQQGAGDITLSDRRNFLNDLMQKYMAGIGLGQNIYGIGAGAGQGMADRAFQHGQNKAGLAYGQQNAPGSLFGGLLGAGMNLLPYTNLPFIHH